MTFRSASVRQCCLFLLIAVGLFFAPDVLPPYAKVGWILYAQAEDDGEGNDENDSQGATLSLGEYRTLIAENLTILEEAEKLQDGAEARLALEEVYGALTAVDRVTFESGRAARVAPPFLLRVEDGTTRLETATAQLRLIRDQIDASSQDDANARLAALDKVLARPEFDIQESLRQRFFNWLEGILDWLFPNRGTRGSGNLGFYTLLGWIIGIASVSAVLLLFGFWVRNLFGTFVSGREHQANVGGGEAVSLTASGARAEATAYATAGNYRDAVRQLYLSALLSMEENGVIRYDRSLTNREVLAQVNRRHRTQAHPNLGSPDDASQNQVGERLQPVVETFDSVWYGVREPDEETFSSYEEEIDDLNRMLEEPVKRGEG